MNIDSAIRTWARAHGLQVSIQGRLPASLRGEYERSLEDANHFLSKPSPLGPDLEVPPDFARTFQKGRKIKLEEIMESIKIFERLNPSWEIHLRIRSKEAQGS